VSANVIGSCSVTNPIKSNNSSLNRVVFEFTCLCRNLIALPNVTLSYSENQINEENHILQVSPLGNSELPKKDSTGDIDRIVNNDHMSSSFFTEEIESGLIIVGQ
jgi:hypothetical protein